ncbi:hypothetical protein C8R43DRAFT_1022586 [Mycena crocata]|nr:hypothetical protein C8R43DRAFT_1022586 [Mycena crocata]
MRAIDNASQLVHAPSLTVCSCAQSSFKLQVCYLSLPASCLSHLLSRKRSHLPLLRLAPFMPALRFRFPIHPSSPLLPSPHLSVPNQCNATPSFSLRTGELLYPLFAYSGPNICHACIPRRILTLFPQEISGNLETSFAISTTRTCMPRHLPKIPMNA